MSSNTLLQPRPPAHASARCLLHGCVRGLAIALAALAVAGSAGAAPTLVKTLDLAGWAGAPVSPWSPPLPPAPNPGFSLTSLALDPVLGRLYAADSATGYIYFIDTASGAVTAVSNTQGVTTSAATPTAYQPITVLANPASGRWAAVSPLYGGRFLGTGFSPTDGVPSGTLPAGAAWDSFTNIIYAGRSNLFATINLKYLYGGFPCAGTTTVATLNPATSRVYVGCGFADANGALVMFDGIAMQKASKKSPQPNIGAVFIGRPASGALGLAVNPNTNRLYAAGLSSGTALDVLDAGTYRLLATIPGLPDQGGSRIVSSTVNTPLPQPVLVNTRTNTVFVLNALDSTVSVFDGATNTLRTTLVVPSDAGIDNPGSELKIGNTVYDARRGVTRTLGGASAMALDEAANRLYVARVNGTIRVYALDAPTGPVLYSINGTLVDNLGMPLPGANITASGAAGAAAAVTDRQGMFALTGLPAGSYSLAPVGLPGYAARTVSIKGKNVVRLVVAPVGATKPFTVSVGRTNPGTVSATPAGLDRVLDCGSACSAKFSPGTAIVLTATPPTGKSFVGWGGACSGTQTSCSLVVNSDLSVHASFAK